MKMFFENISKKIFIHSLLFFYLESNHGTESARKNERPIKHWAKLSYMIKQHSGTEGAN